MSFFDPTMINNPFPRDWENFDLHVEVSERDFQLTQHLEKTNWVHFADGGCIYEPCNGLDDSGKTRWYGLKRESIF
jgi:hypothetical protein